MTPLLSIRSCRAAALSLLIALLVTGCLKRDGDLCGEPAADARGSDVPAVTATLGPEGGTLVGPGEATLVVPPNALPDATPLTVTLAPEDNTKDVTWTPLESTVDAKDRTVSADVVEFAYFQVAAPSGAGDAVVGVGPAYAFEPLGQQFDEPVTVTLPYDPADIPDGVTEADLFLAEAPGCDPTCAGPDCPGCGLTEGFARIPAGTFWMGSPGGEPCPVGYTGGGCDGSGSGMTVAEPGRADNETLHEVTLTYDVEIQMTEVTQVEWEAAFGGWNPSGFSGNASHPVEAVSWFDACAYCNRKSEEEGYPPCYEFSDVECERGANPPDGTDWTFCMDAAHGGIAGATVTVDAPKPQDCEGYRLPTEAEWEYAARAGALSAYPNGQESDEDHLECEVPFHLTDIAWYCGNNDPSGTKAAGQREANAWGLEDMTGNVYEWCGDRYCADTSGSGVDPDGGSCAGSSRVLRGGSWSYSARYVRAAYRFGFTPGLRSSDLGFRPSRSVP